MVCGKCGKSIPEGAVFCCWCGARCEERVCAVCGTKLRSDQLFCHECGLKCDDGNSQIEPQSDKSSSSLAQERPVRVEDETIFCRNKKNRLTVSRGFQAEYGDMFFAIKINNRDMGYIDNGQSIYVDVYSETVTVEIRWYTNELYLGKRIPKVVKYVALTALDHPKISFRVTGYLGVSGNLNVEVVVDGAVILQ